MSTYMKMILVIGAESNVCDGILMWHTLFFFIGEVLKNACIIVNMCSVCRHGLCACLIVLSA